MPCPHCKITIIKRSNNESAVSAAAYQSGEKLFSEYDQGQKYYPYKTEVTHKEIMLPPHVPPEYADRNTLWNSAEAQEKQWNSQLARRFVLAIPREIPSEQHADLIRDYCREFFVSKGMIADFAIHDKGDGNPPETATTDEPNLTPNVEEYLNLKAAHPDKLVGVQVGETILFYGTDAEEAAPALGRKTVTREMRNWNGCGKSRAHSPLKSPKRKWT